MKIINFGSLNIDKVCSVEEFVQPGETIMATGYSVNAGGKGLNQSVAAARAGAQVLHAGAVGSDGLFLKEILADAGADVSCLRVMDTESGCAFIEVILNFWLTLQIFKNTSFAKAELFFSVNIPTLILTFAYFVSSPSSIGVISISSRPTQTSVFFISPA